MSCLLLVATGILVPRYLGATEFRSGSERCDWSGRRTPSPHLERFNLAEADLGGSDLSRADFTCANLAGARLTRADIRWTRLPGANVARGDLRGANLQHADLSSANLAEADLTGADLCGADLTGANLEGAHLQHALFDDHTVWPVDFLPLRAGARAVASGRR